MSQMRNAEGMNMLGQVRKALADISTSQRAGNIPKAYYQAWCLTDMMNRGNRPWSEYRPMIAEEFSEA